MKFFKCSSRPIIKKVLRNAVLRFFLVATNKKRIRILEYHPNPNTTDSMSTTIPSTSPAIKIQSESIFKYP